jgi:hypothetical protein
MIEDTGKRCIDEDSTAIFQSSNGLEVRFMHCKRLDLHWRSTLAQKLPKVYV